MLPPTAQQQYQCRCQSTFHPLQVANLLPVITLTSGQGSTQPLATHGLPLTIAIRLQNPGKDTISATVSWYQEAGVAQPAAVQHLTQAELAAALSPQGWSMESPFVARFGPGYAYRASVTVATEEDKLNGYFSAVERSLEFTVGARTDVVVTECNKVAVVDVNMGLNASAGMSVRYCMHGSRLHHMGGKRSRI